MEAERVVLCQTFDADLGRATSSPDHKNEQIDMLLNNQPTSALCLYLHYHEQLVEGDIEKTAEIRRLLRQQ
jgi:hypothetical protein